MTMTRTHYRILGAFLLVGAFLIMEYFEGTFTSLLGGVLTGLGVLLMINGSLRKQKA